MSSLSNVLIGFIASSLCAASTVENAAYCSMFIIFLPLISPLSLMGMTIRYPETVLTLSDTQIYLNLLTPTY